MNRIENERSQRAVSGVQAVELQTQRQLFEEALNRDGRRGEHGGGHGGEGEGRHDDHAADAFAGTPRRALASAMSAQVMIPLQRSVADSSDLAPHGSSLAELLVEVAQGLRAARRMPGDRWRMEFRIREALLSRTLLEIGCNGGCIDVALRTSSHASYRTLVEGLPQLDRVLRRTDPAANPVQVYLVGRSDLP